MTSGYHVGQGSGRLARSGRHSFPHHFLCGQCSALITCVGKAARSQGAPPATGGREDHTVSHARAAGAPLSGARALSS